MSFFYGDWIWKVSYHDMLPKIVLYMACFCLCHVIGWLVCKTGIIFLVFFFLLVHLCCIMSPFFPLLLIINSKKEQQPSLQTTEVFCNIGMGWYLLHLVQVVNGWWQSGEFDPCKDQYWCVWLTNYWGFIELLHHVILIIDRISAAASDNGNQLLAIVIWTDEGQTSSSQCYGIESWHLSDCIWYLPWHGSTRRWVMQKSGQQHLNNG